jgi:UDP:flavonoid glycosyltransferase YjiC (YdhE family)
LFAWELGSGLGHLGHLLPLARALRKRGHEIFLAVKDLARVQRLGRPGDEFTWFQAPLWLASLRGAPPASSYPEILLHNGFLNPESLLGLARAWHALFAAIRPQLVISNHAPLCLLTSRASPLRRATFGSGFLHPPQRQPMPVFRTWNPPPAEHVLGVERHVLQTANAVLQGLGVAPVGALREIFAVDRALLTVYPELDHYPDREDPAASYVGPVTSGDAGVEAEWPPGAGPRVFAYVKGDYKAIGELLDSLRKGPARVLAYVTNLSEEQRRSLASPWLGFSRAPVRIRAALDAAVAVICHAGVGTVHEALAAGRPVLCLPMQAEQRVMAERVVALGCGLSLGGADLRDLAPALARLTGDARLAEAAGRFAARYAGADPAPGLTQAVEQLDALAKGPSPP